MSDLVGNPEDQFSRVAAHFMYDVRTMQLKGHICIDFVTMLDRVPATHEPRHEETNIMVPTRFHNKPAGTITDTCKNIELSDLRRRGRVLPE